MAASGWNGTPKTRPQETRRRAIIDGSGEPGLLFSAGGLLAVAVLVLINAYFVAAEFSLVAVRGSQLKLWVDAGRRGAGSAMLAKRALDDAIAATQLGITLASLGLGWIGEPAIAGLLEPSLAAIGLGEPTFVHSLSVVIAFTAITFFHVVAGELAPKAVALARPGDVALLAARPLLLFARVVRPALLLMNGAGNLLVRPFGIQPVTGSQAVHSPEELSLLVDEASEAGTLRADTGKMLGNVFRLTRTRVSDVMVPRSEVFAVDLGIELDELVEIVRTRGFTRIPVIDGTFERIIGVLHAKDLFHIYAERRLFVLEDVIRRAFTMPAELPVLEALRRFRRERAHLAIVQSADQRMLGLVTLEDVLEEIVGEIEDEYDVPTAAASD